jgi:NTP pyrophosphatase (non-canonical NTP hydrolase)
MKLDEYQKFCAQGILPATLEREPIIGFALGLAGESGEVVDDIKKKYFHGRDIDPQHTIEELGDVMWYVANIATQLNISLDKIIENNVNKLSTRYSAMYKKEAPTTTAHGQPIGKIFCAHCGKICTDEDGTIHYEASGTSHKSNLCTLRQVYKICKKGEKR